MYTLASEQVNRCGSQRNYYSALNVHAHAKFGNEFSMRCHFWPFQEVLELASYPCGSIQLAVVALNTCAIPINLLVAYS